jgi:thiamine-monophosphate kinase
MQEFELIRKYFRPLAGPGAFGLGDDAALLKPPAGCELVVTKDVVVEGVHFRAEEVAANVAKKALRVNLSDLAAKGAQPIGYLLGLMLPRADDAWLSGFTQGLREDQKTYGITLLGGDTVQTLGPLTISLTAIGYVTEGNMLRRNGAQAGDVVMVSGMLGDAAIGLQVLQGKRQTADDAYFVDRYRHPQPRLALGQALRGVASACMDISDGLAQDAGHLATQSGVAIWIDQARLPVHPALRALQNWDAICAGGDDYELLFTVPAEKEKLLTHIAENAKIMLTKIGVVEKGEGVKIIDGDGNLLNLSKCGWQHFGHTN